MNELVVIGAGTGFYLNYVGCKEAEKEANRKAYFEFYLNYVGCKVSEIQWNHLSDYRRVLP